MRANLQRLLSRRLLRVFLVYDGRAFHTSSSEGTELQI
jgi:hypothetical protein